MTPAELAAKLRGFARTAAKADDDAIEEVLVKGAQTIDRHGSPEVIAATVILVRADLVRAAEEHEKNASQLRAWAREIGEDP